MSYVSVIVHVDLDGGPVERVRLAADLAKQFGAKLIGVAAAVPQPPFVTDGAAIDMGLIEEERKRIQEALETAEARFRAFEGFDALEIDWRAGIDFPNDFLAASACAADLIIIGRENAHDRRGFHYAVDPGDVLMKSGRPVLVVPPGAARLEARRILIAWKNAREARRAMRDALPLLKQAERTIVLGVDDGERNFKAELDDVTDWLRLHGVQAQAELAFGSDAAAEALACAKRERVDLIVAGAYGHARLLEWAFGGVTRDLLRNSPIPCLMAH